MTNIKEQLAAYSSRFNARLSEHFKSPLGPEKRVVEAMYYSLSNGGKRMRPYLLAECGSLFGLSFDQTFKAALSVECLHTYSLIHDDLPSMDNDDLRRGKPTCHIHFDEATAILAGDGLLTYAFELIADQPALVKMLAQNAGAFQGMIAGQMLDLISERQTDTLQDPKAVIKAIEEMKTGCMITYSCLAGATLGQADSTHTQALYKYSRCIGQSFQIADDILDVEGDQYLVGKTLGKDAAQGKVTFVSLYGLDQAKQIAQELTIQAKQSLAIFGAEAENLYNLADYIIDRKY